MALQRLKAWYICHLIFDKISTLEVFVAKLHVELPHIATSSLSEFSESSAWKNSEIFRVFGVFGNFLIQLNVFQMTRL